MAKEIERKYLVVNDSYTGVAVRQIHIMQAYLSTNPDATVRVRIADDKAFLTVKSRNHGAVRNEWEYQIPLDQAKEMIDCCCSKSLEKIRYIVPFGGYCWEVDRFLGRHEGLVVAEIELPSVDTVFDMPQFIGQEVTDDHRYYNSYLIDH